MISRKALKGLDVGLLLAFQALFAERSVTRASVRVALSQPALSHALARLREVFDDELFERRGTEMQPTPKARALAPRIDAVMQSLQLLTDAPRFAPAQHEATVRVALSDYGAAVCLPTLLARLATRAPKLRLQVEPWRDDTLQRLMAGELDLAMGVPRDVDARLAVRELFTDGFCCLVARTHPMATSEFGLVDYLRHDHVVIDTGASGAKVGVDAMLERMGLSRRVALRLPHWPASALVVASTRLILTTPTRLATLLARLGDLVLLQAPIELPVLTYSMVWPERLTEDPAHHWLRHQIWLATRPLRAAA